LSDDSEFEESEFSDSESEYDLSSILDSSSDSLDIDEEDLMDDEPVVQEGTKRRKVSDAPS